MFSQLRAKFLLVRHGETDHNKQGRFCGRSDPPLNARGQKQASLAANHLAQRQIDHVFASPAVRAQQTAQAINNGWGKPITSDERLWETDYGRWEGKNISECRAADPQAWQQWLSDTSSAPHGGETAVAVANRTRAWLDEILMRYQGQTLLVAAHGGSLQTIICHLMETPHRSLWPFRFQNTTVAEVWLYEEGGVLVAFGNHHLSQD
jgi:broad specificity phosphatase PhoE